MMKLMHSLPQALRLGSAVLLVALLWGCGTTAPKKTAHMDLVTLSEVERQTYDQALAALQADQAELAEQRLTPLARQYPDLAEVALNLALAQYHQQQYEQALQSLQPLLQRSPSFAAAHNLAGLIAVHQGRFRDAEQHYQQALAVDAHYPNALYNLALLHDVYFQQVAEAVVYYERYMVHVEEDQETLNWLEHLRFSLGGE